MATNHKMNTEYGTVKPIRNDLKDHKMNVEYETVKPLRTYRLAADQDIQEVGVRSPSTTYLVIIVWKSSWTAVSARRQAEGFVRFHTVFSTVLLLDSTKVERSGEKTLQAEIYQSNY